MTGCDASVVSSVVSFLIELIGVRFRKMKKAIAIIILGLLWCNIGVADELTYIGCYDPKYPSYNSYLFAIDDKRRSIIPIGRSKMDRNNKVKIHTFKEYLIEATIYDASFFKFRDAENDDLKLVQSYKSNVKIKINRVTRTFLGQHFNKEKNEVEYEHLKCRKEDRKF